MVGSKLYKVYPSASIDTIDTSKVTTNIRWNLADTEFIVEFIEPPHGNTSTLSHLEAQQLMQTEKWAVQAEDPFYNP